MKKNIIISFISLSVAAVLTVACTAKFEEFNRDEHNASDADMAVDDNLLGNFFRQMERNVINFGWGTEDDQSDGVYQNVYNLTSDIWAGYSSQTNWKNTTDSFTMTPQYCAYMYNNKMKYVMGNWNKIHQFVTDNDLPVQSAIADIVKIAAMHQVADYYGPTTYTHAGELKPAYDSQEDLYKQFFNELDSAIETLESTGVTSVLTDYDVVYGGNVEQWLKFANSLRLRLAMRVVYADPTLAQAEAEKSTASVGGLITSNDDNAYIKSSLDKNLHGHSLTKITSAAFNDGDCHMGASIVSYLSGYSDPRLAKIALPNKDGNYVGVLPGLEPSSWTPYKNTANAVSSQNAANYLVMWMNAAEVAFLRAEGALRGWNMGGTAKSFYEQGISLSFDEWGVTGAASYIANSTAKPSSYTDPVSGTKATNNSTCTIAFGTSNTFSESLLEKIITQKWIAVYPNGAEGWAEYRRTHYPFLYAPKNNTSGGIVSDVHHVRRCPFPVDESSTNRDNYREAVTLLGGSDNAATRVWWDKKEY